MIHIALSQNFHQSSKDNTVRPILSSQGFWINFRQKFAFYFFQASFAKLEFGTIQVDRYCPFTKIWLSFIKNTHGSYLYFSNISSTFWLSDNTVGSILSFSGSYILSSQGSKSNFHLKLKYFLVFKSSLQILSGTIGFDQYCPSKDLIEISI